ncbi:hypothetical protein JN531_012580 [Flagellatimonas centrodinii]|uniref:hypothetical protein n=1 Tax=Flagellatimonas centrodinii TaxID=2806210 RepID=UPI001FF061F1|nr:hypothetical protein [Flagellatimonas centrodinii]ULQ45935.1 hypothetical protein JN531_012580 [Flagellatimonas centrodinii]
MSQPTETLVLRGLTHEQASQILQAAESIATDAIVWSYGKAYPFEMESLWERIDGNTPSADDVTEAVEVLRKLKRAYVGLIESARDRIINLGGDCDPVDRMTRDDPNLTEATVTLAKWARAAEQRT